MALKFENARVNSMTRVIMPTEVIKDVKNSIYYNDPLAFLGERSFKDPEEIPVCVTGTPIQEFFRDATIFLTGGTGFMGKALTEKLLRSCPHIKHVYLLVRPKKGKEAQERLDTIFKERLFKRLHHEVPNFQLKVSAVAGDCSLPNLGISSIDRERLVNEVNIIFHGAATVRFDEPLRYAIKINVDGTRAIVKLAKDVKNLKSLVHTSTAYSHCPQKKIDEKLYSLPSRYEEILELVKSYTDEEIQANLSRFIGEWPNTYTFTKAIAEHLVKKEGQGLPVAIVRPSIVTSTHREPVRGWIDNFYGPIGVNVGVGTGVLHTFFLNEEFVTDMVPIDLAVNALIASAWKTGNPSKNEDPIPIYNYVSSAQNPLTWGEFNELNQKHYIHWPTIHAMWYMSIWMTKNELLFKIMNFFLHKLIGSLFDAFLTVTGRKPMFGKIYNKLALINETLKYFTMQEWKMTNFNVQDLWKQLTPKDQEIFFFDISQISWEYHFEVLPLGIRVYAFKDDVDTLPAARKKFQRLYYAHCLLKGFTALLICTIVYSASVFIFRIFTS